MRFFLNIANHTLYLLIFLVMFGAGQADADQRVTGNCSSTDLARAQRNLKAAEESFEIDKSQFARLLQAKTEVIGLQACIGEISHNDFCRQSFDQLRDLFTAYKRSDDKQSQASTVRRLKKLQSRCKDLESPTPIYTGEAPKGSSQD